MSESPCPHCGLQPVPYGDVGDDLIKVLPEGNPAEKLTRSLMLGAVEFVENYMEGNDLVFARSPNY